MSELARALLVALALAGCAAPEPEADPVATRAPFPLGTPPGALRVFAPIGEPGQPEAIAVADGRVLVTLSQDGDTTGELLALDLRTGAPATRAVVPKTPGDPDVDLSRFLGVAVDAQGRAYVADTSDPRVLRIDLARDPPSVETYATVPEMAACALAPLDEPCAPTLVDKISLPNALAFGPDGALYVSDTFQATIFRIPAGGGDAQVWFQDARFGDYGVNGLAVGPDATHLYVAQTLAEPVSSASTGVPGGAIHRLPLVDAPAAHELMLVHHYPQQAVDGIAFGSSGRLYATLVGQNDAPHGISVLDPAGEEVAFYTTPDDGSLGDVEVYFPAAVAFHDEHRSVLVPNQAFGHPEWWSVLEAYVDDTGLPLHRPRV